MKNNNQFVFEYNTKTNSYTFTLGAEESKIMEIDIPAVYNDGRHGEHKVVKIGRKGDCIIDVLILKIPATITDIEFNVFECCRTANIIVDEQNPKYKSIDGVLYSKDGESLIRYPQRKNNYSFVVPDGVTDLCGSAFEDCEYLHEAEVTESVRFVGGFAFNRCDNLERVTFKSNKNWILICALDEPPREVGWLSYDCLSDNETAAKYLRDAFTHCVWTITDSVHKELINKNLDDGMDKDAYIDVSKFDFDNCNSDDYE